MTQPHLVAAGVCGSWTSTSMPVRSLVLYTVVLFGACVDIVSTASSGARVLAPAYTLALVADAFSVVSVQPTAESSVALVAVRWHVFDWGDSVNSTDGDNDEPAIAAADSAASIDAAASAASIAAAASSASIAAADFAAAASATAAVAAAAASPTAASAAFAAASAASIALATSVILAVSPPFSLSVVGRGAGVTGVTSIAAGVTRDSCPSENVPITLAPGLFAFRYTV
mmetsp:Transcript_18415/g.29444  ORF Transcript_18415/g.29444 Transcript_18415/m.29444 type:complete len:229 (+) Transcript_18415:858-1544(+)